MPRRTDTKWLVRVTKRKPDANGNADTFTGYCHDDGLQSIYAVKLATGEIRYASVLDNIAWLGEVDPDTPEHPAFAQLPKPTR